MFKSIILLVVLSLKSWAQVPQGIIYAHPYKSNPLGTKQNIQVIAIDEKNEWSRLKRWRQILSETPELYIVTRQWDLASQDQFIFKVHALTPSDLIKEYPEFQLDKIKNFKQAILAP